MSRSKLEIFKLNFSLLQIYVDIWYFITDFPYRAHTNLFTYEVLSTCPPNTLSEKHERTAEFRKLLFSASKRQRSKELY